jgi:hypothetical protein
LISVVDVVSNSAEPNQRRFRLHNFPVVVPTDRLFALSPGGAWTLLIEGTDYILNYGTGELQMVNTSGVVASTMLVAYYTYYTNLIALVQKVLEGDSEDPLNFPGVKAAGIMLRVQEPSPVYVNVRAAISAEEGFLEADLKVPVRRAIEDYINSRKIGEDVIISKMIDAAHNVLGLKDIQITVPSSNQVVLEDQVAFAQDSSGQNLVVVS